jgi:HD-like signal output (HDOD) protein
MSDPQRHKRAPSLAAHLQRIREDPDFPAFARQMQEIMASLSDPEAPMQRLGNLVLRDYSLSVKLLRTANTVQYRRAGQPIRSATHAMMLLGARTVRDLAMGLLVFEHYHRQSPGLKELLLLSMLSAQHAREAAVRMGYAEPEAAYLCAMLHNLGEVLVAHHFPEEYAEVLRVADAESISREHAARKVLKFRPAELGRAVVAEWNMPEAVGQAMTARGEPGEPTLSILARLSHELTEAAYRSEPEAVAAAVAAVERRFLEAAQLDRDALSAVVEAAVRETRALFSDAGVALDDLRLSNQTRAALLYLNGEARGEDGEAEREPTPAEVDREQERAHMLAEIRAAVSGPGADVHAVVLMVLEAALRLGPVDHAVFCLLEPERGELKPRLALGDNLEALRERLRIRTAPSESGPLGPALAQGQDIHLDSRLSAPTYLRWLQRLHADAAIFLGLKVEGATLGTLYFDWRPGAEPLDAGTVEFLLRLRDLALDAILGARRPGARGRAGGGCALSAPPPRRAPRPAASRRRAGRGRR